MYAFYFYGVRVCVRRREHCDLREVMSTISQNGYELVQQWLRVRRQACWNGRSDNRLRRFRRALSLASPGVPGNCRKQSSVPGKLPGDPMVVLVGQMGILSAHAWCGTSVKNTMEETIMKRMINVNHAIL